MRQNGYYWVKIFEHLSYEVALFENGYWNVMCRENGYFDDDLFEIDERPITRERFELGEKAIDENCW